jgi:hypothetical protein
VLGVHDCGEGQSLVSGGHIWRRGAEDDETGQFPLSGATQTVRRHVPPLSSPQQICPDAQSAFVAHASTNVPLPVQELAHARDGEDGEPPSLS